MKVLVTGAAGFIGSSLVDALLRRGEKVVGLDNFDPYYDPARKRGNLAAAIDQPNFELVEGDICDAPLLRSLIRRRCPDGIVHLAARVGNRKSLAVTDHDGYAAVNAGGTAALLDACRPSPPHSFVLVSTANVYDTSAPTPFCEGVTPDHPRTPYSRSKKRAEELVLHAAAENLLPATVLRLFTTYGPRQRPDMVHYRFASSLLRGEPLTLIGAGSDLRDYIHVADACAAIQGCLDRPSTGEVINAGSGVGTSLNELLSILARVTGRKPLMRRRAADARDTRRLLAGIGKAGRLLGWKPTIGLKSGLEDFIAWFKENDMPPMKGYPPDEN